MKAELLLLFCSEKMFTNKKKLMMVSDIFPPIFADVCFTLYALFKCTRAQREALIESQDLQWVVTQVIFQ